MAMFSMKPSSMFLFIRDPIVATYIKLDFGRVSQPIVVNMNGEPPLNQSEGVFIPYPSSLTQHNGSLVHFALNHKSRISDIYR